MNTAEARVVLTAEMEKYRVKGYDALIALVGNDQNYELTGPSGTVYQLDIQAFWDDPRKPSHNLRIVGAIDDRGLSSYAPMCDSFAIAPDGVFVGE
jgi:hypothetical protein